VTHPENAHEKTQRQENFCSLKERRSLLGTIGVENQKTSQEKMSYYFEDSTTKRGSQWGGKLIGKNRDYNRIRTKSTIPMNIQKKQNDDQPLIDLSHEKKKTEKNSKSHRTLGGVPDWLANETTQKDRRMEKASTRHRLVRDLFEQLCLGMARGKES